MTRSVSQSLAQQCPLCGEANQCAIAVNSAASDCWCFHADIPRQVLADLPADERGQRCICPNCANTVAKLAQPID